MISMLKSMLSHGSVTLPWHSFLLSACTIILFLVFDAAPEALVYDRQLIATGEVWRLITAHWVHSDAEHLMWNVAALLMLASFIEILFGYKYLYVGLVAGILGVGAWMWIGMPMLVLYCGLSGILNTLLFIIIIEGWRKTRAPVFVLILLAAAGKIIYEILGSEALFTHTAWPSVPEVHLAGAVAAVLLLMLKSGIKFIDTDRNSDSASDNDDKALLRPVE